MAGLKRPRALLDLSSEEAVLSPAEAAAEAAADARRQLFHYLRRTYLSHIPAREIQECSNLCAHMGMCVGRSTQVWLGRSRHALWGDEPTGRGAKERKIQNRPFFSCMHKPLDERNSLEAQQIFSEDVS